MEAMKKNPGLLPDYIAATKQRPTAPSAVRSARQCDACTVGDHGRCTGVGCFCRSGPATRAAHMAGLAGRTL